MSFRDVAESIVPEYAKLQTPTLNFDWLASKDGNIASSSCFPVYNFWNQAAPNPEVSFMNIFSKQTKEYIKMITLAVALI